MVHIIYAQPLGRVVVEMLLSMLLWAVLSATFGKKKPKIWRLLNLCLLAASTFAVLFMTIMRRIPGEYELILIPGYFLQEGKAQPEIYRALLMNVLLFAPFGLTFSASMPSNLKIWTRVIFTMLVGLIFSVGVEAFQYLGGLGRAEVDDILANTLGTLIGALHLPIGSFVYKLLISN